MALFKLPPPLHQFQRSSATFKFFEGMLLMYLLNLQLSLAKVVSAQLGLSLDNWLIYLASLFLGYPIVVISLALIKVVVALYGVMIDWFLAIMLGMMGAPTPPIGSAIASAFNTLVDALVQIHNDFLEAFWIDRS